LADNTPARRRSKAVEKRSTGGTKILPDVSALGLEEIGTETNLPYSTSYNPSSNGTGRTLVEQWRDQSEEQGPTVRQLQTMRRMDGQARALYRLLTLPIRSALSTSSFVPEDDGEEEQEFIDAVFNTPPESGGMTVTFHRFVSQMLQALFDGFAAFEKVYWTPSDGPLQGKVTLQKLAHRPSETVTFISDDHGGFAGFRQRAYNMGKAIDVFIPKEYAFYYAAQEEERKYYGVSFFQSAFYHYDKKVKMYFIAHLAAQRAAVGTRVGTVPINATTAAKREFLGSLSNLSVAQWMAVPDGFKVEILREAGGFSYLDYINHHNSQMSKSVLAGFFDKDQGAGSGDASLVNFAQPGDEMFNLMLRAIMDDLANQINHYIIPPLVDLNFKSGKYPKFVWGKLTDEQRAGIAATFSAVLAAKSDDITPEFVRKLEEHVAEEYGLEIDYEEIEKRQQEQQAVQAQQFGPDGQPVEPEIGPDGQPVQTPPSPDGTPPQGGAPGAPAPSGAAPAGGAPAAPAPTPPDPNAVSEPDLTDPNVLAEEQAEDDGQIAMPGEDWDLDDFEAMVHDSAAPDTEEDDESDVALSMPGTQDDWGLDDFEAMAFDAAEPGDDEGVTLSVEDQMLDMASDMLALARKSNS
jgi:hypothetical protein